jgi:hypothetical protein
MGDIRSTDTHDQVVISSGQLLLLVIFWLYHYHKNYVFNYSFCPLIG